MINKIIVGTEVAGSLDDNQLTFSRLFDHEFVFELL